MNDHLHVLEAEMPNLYREVDLGIVLIQYPSGPRWVKAILVMGTDLKPFYALAHNTPLS